MSGWSDVVHLHDMDLLLEEARAGGARERARRGGLASAGLPALERARAELFQRLERRWQLVYDRAQRRYGRAVVTVRERVCQGCFITLPTSATGSLEPLSVCESCGRILFRR
jgi:predicted  nucleic acid-binding Zn-ribbon protein